MTLPELAIGLAIAAIMIAIAMPAMNRVAVRQRGREAAHLLAGAFTLARSEAIRTGNVHIVFFQTDATGAPLLDEVGDPTPLLILDDGAPGTGGQNCQIDGGETVRGFDMPANVALGLVGAAGKSAEDLGPGAIVASSSFTTPALAPATWVLFRPEGMPLAFDAVCNVGATGSGAGGFYMNAGGRNYAALLMPLGTTRVSGWNEASAQWSN